MALAPTARPFAEPIERLTEFGRCRFEVKQHRVVTVKLGDGIGFACNQRVMVVNRGTWPLRRNVTLALTAKGTGRMDKKDSQSGANVERDEVVKFGREFQGRSILRKLFMPPAWKNANKVAFSLLWHQKIDFSGRTFFALP